jgi:hypothetical protein
VWLCPRGEGTSPPVAVDGPPALPSLLRRMQPLRLKDGIACCAGAKCATGRHDATQQAAPATTMNEESGRRRSGGRVGLRRELGAQGYIGRVRLVVWAGLKSSAVGSQCILVNRGTRCTKKITDDQ